MIYALYFLLIAIVFGLIALIDFLLKKILPKPKHTQKGNIVRMPRYSFILGIVIFMLAMMALLFVPFEEKLVWFGAWVVLAMGIFLLVNFFRFAIFFDDDGFTYRTLTKKAKSYPFEQITAQESFLAKSGWNSTLYIVATKCILVFFFSLLLSSSSSVSLTFSGLNLQILDYFLLCIMMI